MSPMEIFSMFQNKAYQIDDVTSLIGGKKQTANDDRYPVTSLVADAGDENAMTSPYLSWKMNLGQKMEVLNRLAKDRVKQLDQERNL